MREARLKQDSQLNPLSLGITLALHPSPSIYRVLLHPEERTISMAWMGRCLRCSAFCLDVKNAVSPLFSCNFMKGSHHKKDNDYCSNDGGELLNMVAMCQAPFSVIYM